MRTFKIRALYGTYSTPVSRIVAPDLESAFNIARAWWPSAYAWESV